MPLPVERKPRFLQVNTFYPAYLADFYAAHPELGAAPYDAQIEALLDDGFSGPHMMTRPMARRGWETMQLVVNAGPAQARWLAEQDLSLPAPIDGVLVAAMQIEMFRPDVIYFTEACKFDSRFVRKLPTRPPIVVGWRGYPIDNGTDWRDYDLILTSFDAIVLAAPGFGARDVQRHYPGFPVTPGDAETTSGYDCDVIFCGSVTRHHLRRIALLHTLWRASRGGDGAQPFAFHLHMPDAQVLPPEMRGFVRPSLWGNAMLRAFRRARIVVNIDVDAFGGQPPNMRLIEATGAGGFLLTGHHDELPRFFTPGQEIETFRDEAELLGKIRHYLAADTDRARIARAGQDRCLREDALDQTAARFHDMVREKLARKP